MKETEIHILQVITNLGTGGAEKLLVDSMPIYIAKNINMDLLLLNGGEHPFYESLIKSNIKIFDLGKGSVYNLFHIFRIIPYLKKYDIVHVHLFPTLYWVAIAKFLSFSKVKLVFTEHSTFNKRMEKRGWRFFDQLIYKNYCKIVSITNEVDIAIKRHLGFKEKGQFCIISNGINLSAFQYVDKKKEVNVNDITIIQVSSFGKQKDQETLIRAMSLLPQSVKLYLVGDGENRNICETLVKDLDLQERVLFLGIRMDIPHLLHICDIAVLSSHNEGFGLSAVEAMASGKPLIASDVPGLRDVVRGAGLLFPKGSEEKLVENINKLLTDNEFYQSVSLACWRRAQEFDINIMVDNYLELYKNVLKS